jgi:hypothetical protein
MPGACSTFGAADEVEGVAPGVAGGVDGPQAEAAASIAAAVITHVECARMKGE